MINDIASYLTTQMVTNWAENDCQIVYDNQPESDHSNAASWARFSVIVGNQSPSSLGNSVTDQTLRVVLQIFVATGNYTGRANELADTFIELFRYHQYQGAEFYLEGSRVDMNRYVEEGWYQLNVSVRIDATF